MTREPEIPDEVREAIRAGLLDEDLRRARRDYASTMRGLLSDVSSWLAVDSWLGAGKVDTHEPSVEFGEAFAEFRGVATVLCMAAELASAAVSAIENDQGYTAAALVRQLIECEYLLTLFADDLDHARRWRASSPDELRAEFTPAKMRKLTGFANEEYWNHCDVGGHPNPKGARLLEFLDPLRGVWPYAIAEMSIDLGLHLRRTWNAIDKVLAAHHARFADVRSAQRQEALDAWAIWNDSDPLVATFIALSS